MVTFQGHGIFLPFNLASCHTNVSPKLFDFFQITQMLASVGRYAEPMTQLRTVKVKLTLEGNGIFPSILIILTYFFVSAPYLPNRLNDFR